MGYHMIKHLNKSLISLAVLSAVYGSQAFAQETEKQEKKQLEVDEVIEVKGIRNQVASSQEIKRLADTVKDVITSDDIGALPDKSVTEALQRVPGITIERFDSSDDPNHFSSEGTGVIVRGLKRIRSEINGRDAFSASSTGGGLSYADIPGELLGRIEVVKNTTSDLIAGGVAGTVNLVTRKPFDSDDQIIYGQIKGSYGDHREEWTPSGTFMFSDVWKGDHGKFGFLLGYTDSEYKDRGDGVGIENYYERSATARETEHFGNNGTAIPGYEDKTLYAPAGVAIRTADSDRTREGLFTSVQWQNTAKTLTITGEYISSEAQRDWSERVVQYGEQGFIVNPNNVGVVNGQFDDQGFMIAGELNNNFMLAQSRYNQSGNEIEDISFNLVYSPNDNLDVSFDYQKVDATNKIKDWTYSSMMMPTFPSWYGPNGRPETTVPVGAEFDLSGSLPTNINFVGDGANPMYNEQAFMNSKMDHEEFNEADSSSYALDLEYRIDEGWISAVKAGLYVSEKNQLSRNSIWNWQSVSPAWSWQWAAEPAPASLVLHPEIYEAYTFGASEFFGGGVLNGDQTFYFPLMSGVHNYHDFGASMADFTPFAGPDLAQRANTTDGYLDSEITDTTEDRWEVYLMADYMFDDLEYPVKGNFGLRYISWQVESTGAILFPNPFPGWDPRTAQIAEKFPDAIPFANAAEGPQTTIKGEEYTKVLPSFNLSMEISEEHIARFAISQNVYFPVFEQFRNYQELTHNRVYDYSRENIVAVNFSGKTGNPLIEPEEALNIDLSLEWYFSDAGSLNVSLFRKELDNLIRQRLTTENVENPTSGAVQSVDYQSYTNEGSGNLSGFEISYTQFYDFLPGAWSGLGFSANYTFIAQSDIDDKVGFGEGSDGDGGRNNFRAFKNLDLPGYSDDTLNLALMYEKYDISARMAYSWRSDYLLTRRDADLFAPVVAKATGQLDASVAYQINDNFKVGFEASNILDEVIETEMMYEQNGRQTPRSHFKTDRRFSVYVSAKF